MSTLTVEDLSKKLKSARYKNYLKRRLRYEYGIEPTRQHREYAKDPRSSLFYFNKNLVMDLPFPTKLSEDQAACLLHDLCSIPTALVKKRMIEEFAPQK